MSRRLDKLEPQARAGWEAAWRPVGLALERIVPDHILERATQAPDDETKLEAFLTEHDLMPFDTWLAEKDGPIPPLADDESNLGWWPSGIPTPPPEPEGLWESLRELMAADTGDRGAYAALALYILGVARAVREMQA
jgi:hypothetical protein